MKKVGLFWKMSFWASMLINILLITLVVLYYYRNSDKLKQRLILAKGNPEMVMFGDSHTANARWTALLPGVRVVTLGFSGFTSDQLKSMLMIKVLPLKPEFCFIQGGGNDINSRCYDKSILIASIQSMVDTLLSHNTRPVLQSLFKRNNAPDYNQEVDSINELLRQVALKYNIAFLDINEKLVDDDGLKKELTPDNIHLNNKGYLIWSEILKSYLDKVSYE